MSIVWVVQSQILEKKKSITLLDDIEKYADLIEVEFDQVNRKLSPEPDIKKGEAIIAYGSVGFVRHMLSPAFSGHSVYAYGFDQTLKFHNYYEYAPLDRFLNNQITILPWGLVDAYWENLELQFGKNFFIRPNSIFKTFTGFCPSSHADFLSVGRLQHIGFDELCIVSRQQKITNECRLIACKGTIIGASPYSWNQDEIDGVAPDDMIKFGQNLALKMHAKNQLDECFTIDLCYDEKGSVRIVEFNSFASAGLYNCDTNIIASMVTELTRSLHDDFS